MDPIVSVPEFTYLLCKDVWADLGLYLLVVLRCVFTWKG